jgi:hypothetical protein
MEKQYYLLVDHESIKLQRIRRVYEATNRLFLYKQRLDLGLLENTPEGCSSNFEVMKPSRPREIQVLSRILNNIHLYLDFRN